MLDRAYRLSSCWSYFSDECDRFRGILFHLVNSTIGDFVALKVQEQQPKPSPADSSPFRKNCSP